MDVCWLIKGTPCCQYLWNRVVNGRQGWRFHVSLGHHVSSLELLWYRGLYQDKHWSSTPFLAWSSWNICNFLKEERHKSVFVMLLGWLLDPTLGWQLVARRPSIVIRGLQLSVPPLTSREGLEVESTASGQWFNQLWLCKDALQNPQKDRVQKLPVWGTHVVLVEQ